MCAETQITVSELNVGGRVSMVGPMPVSALETPERRPPISFGGVA